MIKLSFLIINKHGLMNNVPIGHILRGNKTLCGFSYNKSNRDHRIETKPIYDSFGIHTARACQRCAKKNPKLYRWNPRENYGTGAFEFLRKLVTGRK